MTVPRLPQPASTRGAPGRSGQTADADHSHPEPNVYPKLIGSAVLPGTQSQVTFPVPGGFQNLQLKALVRGDAAVAVTSLGIRFNGDSSADYDWVGSTLKAAIAGGDAIGATFIQMTNFVAAANAPVSEFSAITVDVPGYISAAARKSLTGMASRKDSEVTGNLAVQIAAGWWLSTVPITALQVFPTAGSFVAGSVFSLYGLP